MKTTVKHIKTGKVYPSKSEAIESLGVEEYNKALENNELVFITTYDPTDIIF